MELPQGISPTQPNQVYKLKKSLYGLKKSSRQWFAQLSSSLLSQGYNNLIVIIPYFLNTLIAHLLPYSFMWFNPCTQ